MRNTQIQNGRPLKDVAHAEDNGESSKVLQQAVCQWLFLEPLSKPFCCEVLAQKDGAELPANLLDWVLLCRGIKEDMIQ